MCTYFSVLRNLFGPQMDPAKFRRELARAKRHLEFVFSLYELQASEGRYYLHEHPSSAASWREHVVVDFIAHQPDAFLIDCPMCAFGQRILRPDGSCEGMSQKRTRWLTNCAGVASSLSRKCTKDHDHVPLRGGRAVQGQVYPPELCKAIVQGLKKQLSKDECAARFPQSDQGRLHCEKPHISKFSRSISPVPQWNLEILNVEEMDWSQWEATDDVKAGWLPPDLVC